MSQPRVSGYIQPQTWLQTIGNAVTLAASVATLSFTFAVFLGWMVQVIPNINELFNRTNHLGALVDTPGGPLYVNSVTDAVTIGCNGSSIELCYFLHNLNLTGGSNVTLSTLAYTNGASFMSGVTNGENALDALVTHDQLQDTQITSQNNTVNSLSVTVTSLNTTVNSLSNITLSSLGYTNGASFMTGVNNGKSALDALVTQTAALVASNGTVTLSTLAYTNPAFFTWNVTTGKGAFDNTIQEVVTQSGQIAALNAVTSRTFYVSATYGNDLTCDATKLKPCATLYKTLQFYPNVTSQFAQNTILFDNGLYAESNYIPIPPNTIFSGNEIGTLLIFGAGAGYHPTAWSYTGTGYVSWLRFGLIRCSVASCHFNEADVAPATPIFAVHRFYNSTLDATTPFIFTRAASASSYLRLTMESTVFSTGSLTVQDPTDITWSISGDIYATVTINYNTSLTYSAGIPVVNMGGMTPHAAVAVNNYVSGLIVDWSIMNVVLRDAATMTRNYVSGASINVHGDVLGLGVINGGLLSTGAGSGTTEYLTKAPGLGYTPTTSGDWPIVPINQQQADDYLASRTKTLEDNGLKSSYHVNSWTVSGTLSSSPIAVPLNSGPQYTTGSSVFARTAGGIMFNGSSITGFTFTTSFGLECQYDAGAFSQLILAYRLNSGNECAFLTPVNGAGVSGGDVEQHRIFCSMDLFLSPGDSISANVFFTSGPTGFTARIISGVNNYFRLQQFT